MRDSVKYRFGDRGRCQVAVVLKTMHNVSNIHRFTYQTLPLGIFSIVFSIQLGNEPCHRCSKTFVECRFSGKREKSVVFGPQATQAVWVIDLWNVIWGRSRRIGMKIWGRNTQFSFSDVIKFTAIKSVFWLFCILTFIVIVSNHNFCNSRIDWFQLSLLQGTGSSSLRLVQVSVWWLRGSLGLGFSAWYKFFVL